MANRLQFPNPSTERERVWLLEFGVPVARRWSLGAEVTSLGTVTGGTRGLSFEISEKQREALVQGLVRFRPLVSGRVALDFIGGAGVLFQNPDSTSCLRPAPCRVRSDEGRRSPTLSAGIDVPVALASHLELSGIMRVLALLRGESDTFEVPRRSSTRVVAGVTGRVGW